MPLHNEIPALLPFCVDVAKCRSCSNYNQGPVSQKSRDFSGALRVT